MKLTISLYSYSSSTCSLPSPLYRGPSPSGWFPLEAAPPPIAAEQQQHSCQSLTFGAAAMHMRAGNCATQGRGCSPWPGYATNGIGEYGWLRCNVSTWICVRIGGPPGAGGAGGPGGDGGEGGGGGGVAEGVAAAHSIVSGSTRCVPTRANWFDPPDVQGGTFHHAPASLRPAVVSAQQPGGETPEQVPASSDLICPEFSVCTVRSHACALSDACGTRDGQSVQTKVGQVATSRLSSAQQLWTQHWRRAWRI